MNIGGNPLAFLETEEMIEKLIKNGYGDIVKCLIDSDHLVYTKKGRLNKSSTCREMGWKTKDLEDAIEGMKECLRDESNE